MAYSLEQIFHTAPKKIGMIEIYSNPMDRKTVQDIEKVIKSIAKNLKVNLDNIPSGETLRVFIYPTKRVFYSIFGNEVEQKMRRTISRTQETMLFVVGENEIHMVSPRVTGSSYADIIGILVKDILEEYGLESKVRKAKEQVKSELEPEEEVIEEEEEEIDEPEEELEDEDYEEELEELDESELSDSIEEIDYQIEIQKEKDENSIPEWLELGWIMYRRGILNSDKNRQDYAEFIAKKGVTKQNKITQKSSVMADYNFASESSAAIIEYIVLNYGVRRIFDLVGEPSIEKTLRISESKFKREYTAWIKKRYVIEKLEKNLEEKKKEESNKIKQDVGENVKEKDTK